MYDSETGDYIGNIFDFNRKYQFKNPNCTETTAIFRIIGPKVDPAVITESIGIPPDFQVSVGDVFPPGTKPRRDGIWSIEAGGLGASTDLEIHIRALLEQLPDNFVRLIPAGSRCEMNCVWHSATGYGGPIISAETLGRLAALLIPIGFDFYSDV